MSRLILLLLVSLGWWLFIPIQAVRTETGDELHQEIEHLIEQLGNDDWHIREAATRELIRRGEPARAAIKQARAHPDPEVRLRARYIFKQIKWGLSPALREKIGHLMDNYDRADEPTRQKIIGKLATHKELAAPVLVRILIYEESDRLCQLVFYLVQQWLNQPEIVSRARAILGKVNSFWALRMRGAIAEREKNLAQAIRYYEAAFQIKSSDRALVAQLYRLYEQTRQWDQAMALYQKLIELNPGETGYYFDLGRIYEKKGEPEQAHTTWNQILKISGVKGTDYYRLINLYEERRLLEEAIKVCATGLKRFPEDTHIKFHLAWLSGRVSEKKGEVKAALDAYLKAKQTMITESETSDMMDEAIVLLARSCSEADVSLASLVDKIKKSFTGAEPGETGLQYKAAGYVLQARLYQGHGDYQPAAAAMEQALKLKPDVPKSLYYLIDLYRQGGCMDKALKRCEQLKEIKPKEARSYYLTALVYQKSGHQAGVDECLQRVRELTRSAPEGTHFQLGEFLKERGAVEWAQTEFETVLTKSPHNSINDANACGNLAQWAQAKEDYATALNYTERERPIVLQENVMVLHDLDTFFRKVYFNIPQARKMDFFDSGLHQIKGNLLHQQGELEPGNLSLSQALEIYPGNVAAFESIAELARENKFPQDKFKELTRAIIKHYQHQIDTEPFSSIHYYHLANVYLILEEQVDEARGLIKEALVLEPAVLEYQATRARLYAQQKRYQEARAIIKLLTNLKPDEKAYRELLEEVSKSVKDKSNQK